MTRKRQASRPQTATPAPTPTINVYGSDAAGDAPHPAESVPSAAPRRTKPTPPGWTAADEITELLDRITEPHKAKKTRTIFALVDARLAGRSEETVWSDPAVCNRSTYHTKWKRDPAFAEVLAACTRGALLWRNRTAADALQAAAEGLALASPDAVRTLTTLLFAVDPNIARQAAVNILDRAGLETAAKVQQQQIGSTLEEWRQDAERRRRQVDAMLEDMDEDDTQEEAEE